MKTLFIKQDETAFIARALVSNNYTWDYIKSTIRNINSCCNGDINKVVELVKKDRNLKRVYKDYLLIQLAREHSNYSDKDKEEEQ